MNSYQIAALSDAECQEYLDEMWEGSGSRFPVSDEGVVPFLDGREPLDAPGCFRLRKLPAMDDIHS